jgi:hypothetical protein
MATIQPVRGSARAVTCTVLEPSVALVDGDPFRMLSRTTMNGSSLQASRNVASRSSVVSPAPDAVGRA